MSGPVIRLAARAELPTLNAIYNHYVATSTCTYQTEPASAAEREAWFDAHGPEHPVTVLEERGEVLGWGALSLFRPREAYRRTVENSLYIRADMQGRGYGSALLADLLERARALGHHSVIGVISADQEPSLRLHRRFGFENVARIKEAGYKFERWLDVVYVQLLLGNP